MWILKPIFCLLRTFKIVFSPTSVFRQSLTDRSCLLSSCPRLSHTLCLQCSQVDSDHHSPLHACMWQLYKWTNFSWLSLHSMIPRWRTCGRMCSSINMELIHIRKHYLLESRAPFSVGHTHFLRLPDIISHFFRPSLFQAPWLAYYLDTEGILNLRDGTSWNTFYWSNITFYVIINGK